MESYSKILLGLGMILMLACSKTEPDPIPQVNSDLNELERLLVNTWKYDSIVCSDTAVFYLANQQMEVGTNSNALGGNRADLFRRRITYFANRTYQLQWIERGEYDLGTYGDPNWQPNYGFWQMSGDTLIHSMGMYYETRYQIEVNGSSFVRTSNRVMSGCNVCPYSQGEVVKFSENFVKVN